MRFVHYRSCLAGTLLAGALVFATSTGCQSNNPPGRTYYQRNIEPVLLQTCAGNVAGCHSTNEDDPHAFAAGNFDVTSFESVQKRRDLLEPFGAYPVPLLLVKAVGSTNELQVAYGDDFELLEVQHSGGNVLAVGSEAYLTLLEWMENGATASGLPPSDAARTGQTACSNELPGDFDPQPYLDDPSFAEFESAVQPVLEACGSGTCHGTPQSDFYVTCGDSREQIAFNFRQAQAFVGVPVGNSPLLRVPLAVSAGGFFHTGGDHFRSTGDQGYASVQTWAEKVGPIDFGTDDPGRQFFADHVQPMLLRRGCMFEGCHSPAATNDFKLRSGSPGFFSALALEKNYDIIRNDFMAIEVPDARRGRAVSKTILPVFGGIAHRGGAVMETPGSGGSDPANCPQPFDPAAASAFCIVQEWVSVERQQLIDQGLLAPLAPASTVPLVYVERAPAHVASLLAFDTYQPGSDLLVADATLGEGGAITGVGAPRSLLDTCPGAADRAAVDVRSPDVRFDGVTVAFAMRTAASGPLAIYTVGIDGSGCQRVADPGAPVDGIAVHDFDPAWSPDGEHIVFASTRGGARGPSLSRQLFLPQSDIWRMQPDGTGLEQITYLTNSEISPQHMREGRIIMTTEKVSDGFYQLAGRRINWDRTDYHPLLAQRAESPFANGTDPDEIAPSVGYAQATEIREAFNGNFLLILSEPGARGGAGTLAIFNRSVGTFEAGRDDSGFLESLVIPDPAATGRAGASTSGAYRSPFPLPDGRVMASYANYSGDLAAADALDWDLMAVDPRTGDRALLIGGAGAQVEAVLAIPYPPREPYSNFRQLVFGGGVDLAQTGGEQAGVVHFPDAPMVFTLLNANLRRGRPVALFREASHLAFYEERPAPPGTTTGAGPGGIYQERVYLGRVPLAEDGSVKARVPAGTPVILELQRSNGDVVETMREEHQIGPGEVINLGVSEALFDGVCGGCHGSVSGQEIDIAITPDVLTGASESLSANDSPRSPER